jgi:hypothetical protein
MCSDPFGRRDGLRRRFGSWWIFGTAGALILAGCSSTAPPAPAGPSFGEITAAFVTARDDQVIEIRALDSRAISGAELVLADGTHVPSYSIDTVRDPSRTEAPTAMPGNQIDANVTGEFQTGTFRQTTTLIGQIASVALIRVTQPADYAAHWRQARLVIRMGQGEQSRAEILEAPPPPSARDLDQPSTGPHQPGR